VWSTRFGTIMGISAGVDASGNGIILVSEASSHSIKIYTPAGDFVRAVGSGPGSGRGQLNGPRDAATDAAGRIYVADYANSRVEVFSATGTALGGWGVNGTGPGQFKRPYGIDVDDAGQVYVADSNNYVHRFAVTFTATGVTGSFVRAYGSPGTGPGRFQMLRRAVVGSGANPRVYGADLWTYKIEIFESGGAWAATLGGSGPADGYFNEPYGLAIDGQHLFVVDMVNQRVQRFASSAPYGYQLHWGARGWGEGNPGFNWARDAALSTNGGTPSVWVTDTKNNRMTEFWKDGTATGRRFGTGGSGVGQLNWPHAVAAVGSQLIIANTVNNRVERWDPAGSSVVWSVGQAAGVTLGAPKDVAVANGEVYVADTLNRRVVVLSASTGAVLRTFGGGTLRLAEGIAVEPNGDVWVADTSANRLVEFAPNGTVLQTHGTLGSGTNQFNKPAHLEVLQTATDVLLFVVDSWNDRVAVLDIG
jgi:tripartite motif-containing protein 71